MSLKIDNSEDEPLVERVAEEMLERKRRGESPSVEEYCAQYPAQADELRSFLPALLAVEGLKPDPHDDSGTYGSGVKIAGEKRESIGDYRILRELGRGGMGIVYEAEQQALGRRVALKVLSSQTVGNDKSVSRFQSEAKAAARMHHTNIVPVFDVGQDGECLYYAMQLIQGQSLDLVVDDLKRLRDQSQNGGQRNGQTIPRERSAAAGPIAVSLMSGQFHQDQLGRPDSSGASLRRKESEKIDLVMTETVAVGSGSTTSAVLPGESDLSTAESDRKAYFLSVASIGFQVASALAYSHERGIIHRDIKPSNLILDTGGVVWVTDFGLAKTGDSSMTQTGDILGTLRYMSPERFQGKCDVRADLYSLGLSLYELLTLKEAFSAPDQLNLVEKITKSDPKSPRSLDVSVPQDLETIVLKSIDKDPKRRYQSADEMAEDLQRFLHDEPILARRVSMVERYARWSRRNRGLAVSLTALAASLVLITFGSVFFAQKSSADASEMSRLAAVSDQAAKTARDEKEKADVEKDHSERLRKIADFRLAESLFESDRGTARQVRKVLQGSEVKGEPSFHHRFLANRLGYTSTTYLVDEDQPFSVAFGPGATVYTLTLDGQLRHWGESRDRPLKHLDFGKAIGSDLSHVELSQDGRLAALATTDNRVYLVDTSTGGMQVIELDDFVIEMDFFDEGHQLALTVTSFDEPEKTVSPVNALTGGKLSKGEVRIDAYSSDTGAPLGPLCAPFRATTGYFLSEGYLMWMSKNTGFAPRYWESIRISNDGRKIVIPGFPTKWSAGVLGEDEVTLKTGYEVDYAAISSDGDTIVTGAFTGNARVFDGSGSIIAKFTPHSGEITALEFSPNDRLLATGGHDGLVRVYDMSEPAKPRRLFAFKGHAAGVTSLRFSYGQRRLVSAGRDGVTRIWELESSAGDIELSSRSFLSVDISADGRRLAGSRREACEVWNLDPIVRIRSLKLPLDAASKFFRDGKRLAAVGPDGVEIWDVDRGQIVRRIDSNFPVGSAVGNIGANCIAISPDERYLAAGFGGSPMNGAGTKNYRVGVWDILKGEKVGEYFHKDRVYSVSFSPGGNLLASASDDGSAIIWDLDRKQVAQKIELERHTRCFCARFSSDGNALAVSSFRHSPTLKASENDSLISLFNTKTWELNKSINTASYYLYTLSFSNDGRSIIGGGLDHVVRKWDVESGELLANFASEGETLAISESADGKFMATAGNGLRLWPTQPTAWGNPVAAAASLDSVLSRYSDPFAHQEILHSPIRHPETMDELLRLRPDDPELKFANAESHLIRGDTEEANKAFDRAIGFCSDLNSIQENEPLVHAYADALLRKLVDGPDWQPLDEMEVEINGMTEKVEASEAGVLIGGDMQTYTLHAKCPLSRIGGFRAEWLPEVGVGDDLTSFYGVSPSVFSIASDGEMTRIELQRDAFGRGSFSSNGEAEGSAEFEESHSGTRWATFICRESVDPAPEKLRFVIRGISNRTHRRLRLSVTDKIGPNTDLSIAGELIRDRTIPAMFRLAAAFYLTDEIDRASEAFQIAKRAPTSSRWRHESLAAMILWKQGMEEESKALLEQALKPRPAWANESDFPFLKRALVLIDSADEESMSTATDNLIWHSRAAFLREGKQEDLRDAVRRRTFNSAHLAKSGQWYKAALTRELYVRGHRHAASQSWVDAVVLHAVAARLGDGDEADYRRICNAMIDRLKDNDGPMKFRHFMRVAKSCAILETSGINKEPLDRLTKEATQAFESGAWKPVLNHGYLKLSQAVSAYRNKDYQQAKQYAEEVIKLSDGLRGLDCCAHAVVSLSLVGEGEEFVGAQTALDQAKKSIEDLIQYHDDGSLTGPAEASYTHFGRDTLIGQLLILEAEQRLGDAANAANPSVVADQIPSEQ